MSQLLQLHEPGQTPLPHADAVAVGIDLGTTHSVVAVSSNREPEAIHDTNGQAIIPSVVRIQGARRIVGHEARAAALKGESGVISSIKRRMGKSAGDATPVEISADILRHLKQMAQDALGRNVTKAVITVPAYFDDAARTATKDAARLAGLDVLRLINEPTAAALAYGLDSQSQGVFAVYDFGGGTFDISILKLKDGVFQVLATAGYTELGGDDIDRAIADYVSETLKLSDLTPERYGQLLGISRQAKERLTTENETMLSFEHKEVPLSRAQLESMAAPLIARSIAMCEQALHDAGFTPNSITGAVLVGGSTRMPLVKRMVAELFGQAPLDTVDPDLTVALGAAIQAEALTKGADHLLLDVTPLSLGLETMGGIVEKIIERNSPIPASVSQEFTTYKDGQTAMKIHVVQGEREKVTDCRSLAQFELRGIPPLPAGIARIRVQFVIDTDGLLTVSAKELTTGTEQQVEVKPSYGLAFEEIERMLAESMRHARADIAERLLIETRVEAERVAIEVESAMQSDASLLKTGEQSILVGQITRLRKAIAGADRERIDYEREELNKLAGPFAERRMSAAIKGALAGKNIENIG